jgi:hypothetical protein
MTVVHHHTAASQTHETTAVSHGCASHQSTHVDLRARAWRSSLFRHTLHAWHPSHASPHTATPAADHLMHVLGHHADAHAHGRHDNHGNRQHANPNGNPRHRQPGSQSDSRQNQNQKHKQQQQAPRHAKADAQPPRHTQRPARHPMHGMWLARRDAGGNTSSGSAMPSRTGGGGSGSNGGQGNAPRDPARDKTRQAVAAIGRVAAVVRTELQALAERTADQPFVYTGAMREAVIRQRCAGHDPFAVAIDIVNARQLANDDTRSSYHDLHSFLTDFKRLSEGTHARGALTPLLAFHDLRPSTASLRTRSLNQLAMASSGRVPR